MLALVAEAVRGGRRSRSIHVLVALLLPIPFLLVAHQLYDALRWHELGGGRLVRRSARTDTAPASDTPPARRRVA